MSKYISIHVKIIYGLIYMWFIWAWFPMHLLLVYHMFREHSYVMGLRYSKWKSLRGFSTFYSLWVWDSKGIVCYGCEFYYVFHCYGCERVLIHHLSISDRHEKYNLILLTLLGYFFHKFFFEPWIFFLTFRQRSVVFGLFR